MPSVSSHGLSPREQDARRPQGNTTARTPTAFCTGNASIRGRDHISMNSASNRPAFGSARFPDARDLSEYLVHLTKSEEDLANILLTGHLEARNPFGLGRLVPQVRPIHLSACLTEAPL